MVNARLKKQLKAFLEKKAEHAQLEKELEQMKKELAIQLDAVAKANGFMNGRLGIPDVAMVSVALNAPKLIWSKTGVGLTPTDRDGVALLLSENFIIQDVRVPDILKAVERGDKELKKLLASKGISVVQESRYDIKKA